ncbi:MAG: protein-export chaperone SecB [Desulfobulbaceae bacterium]|uniref:Protein-export chaperone SecB n=1 Tax=Candidatus Desulfatifera sulfidica TaxID=2841691 RepID=A0A8J6TED1_9BACT|nr:protein-export chaperone SecB [Candidatus Desulfatifera sulfidica]
MTEENGTGAAPEQPVFRMQKMFIKDLSFESPNSPDVFLQQGTTPKVDVNLKLNNRKIDDDHWEVSLEITAKIEDKGNNDRVMFVMEIEHAGIYLLKNIPAEHLDMVLGVDCPTLLFPFTRQIISQLSVDGGFVPFQMDPINFMALFQESRKKKAEQEN